jgi:hypothetical protein
MVVKRDSNKVDKNIDKKVGNKKSINSKTVKTQRGGAQKKTKTKTIQKAGAAALKLRDKKALWDRFARIFKPDNHENDNKELKKFVARRLALGDLWILQFSDIIEGQYPLFGWDEYMQPLIAAMSWYDQIGKNLPEFQ